MRSFNARKHISTGVAAIALLAIVGGCDDNNQGGGPAADPNPTVKVGDTPFLPPTYTEQQCTDLVATFPGWAAVDPMPEYDAQGRPTLFYAVIPITAASQLDDLALIGIDVQPEPIFVKEDPNADPNAAGPSITTKSTCGKYEIHWALVPGPMFNAIKKATLQEHDTIVDAIIVQPVPDVFADTSITYHGAHPASYEVLRDAGYLYMGVNAPPPDGDTTTVQGAFSLSGAWHSITSGAHDLYKKAVRTAAGWTHQIPDLIERGIGWLDCRIQGCVNLRVNLDLRNTDPAFGGSIGTFGGPDASTKMVRAWGAGQSSQMQLPGVTIAAVQSLVSVSGYGINMRFEGTTNSSSSAGMEVRKGKPTRICMPMENDAATLNDYFTRTEICGLERGAAISNVFQRDTTMTVEVQNRYVNILAQLTDSRAYMHDVAGYTPRKLSALVGPIANTIGKVTHGRAMTPCLDFPNVAIDAVDAGLVAAASLVPGVGTALAVAIAAAEVAIEVDMWLPDSGGMMTRGIPTHEYGHFTMCALLYDEDWTAMVQIPSLMIQRISEGTDQAPTDSTGYIMEGWADFFAGQVASGSNYFELENARDTWDPHVAYCFADNKGCLDWNYVEDDDLTKDGDGSRGFNNQVRRIATTLLDAFDGNGPGTNAPGVGDFWATDMGTGFVAPSAKHGGDAKDEVIRLPGSAMRTLIHNWTHAHWPGGWRVQDDQFFSALNTTIRAAQNPDRGGQKYSWCDACEMFSQHDGLSCATAGFSRIGGVCVDGGTDKQPMMTMAQKVGVCAASPTIPGFIGAPPAATDPSSACTFAGCPARSILVGSIGDTNAACVACGAHQVARGNACVDCGVDQVAAGADGNTCVACPAGQVPNAARTACMSCGTHQVGMNGACVTCPANQVVAPDNTCRACPAGQVPMSNNGPVGATAPYVGDSCIPAAECTCTGSTCRIVNSDGVCVNVIG